MAIHQKAFREALYIEHLEEAAFQYETRLAWLQDEEVGWQDLEGIDAALEAHIDALLVGEKMALDICIENLAEADASMLHVIVRVFCRYRLINNLSKLWADFDFDDPAKVKATADALKWECPQEWLAPLIKVFRGDRAEMFPVLAASVAQHSRDAGQSLLSALTRTRTKDLAEMIWAISCCDRKIRESCITTVSPYLMDPDPAVVEQSAKTLMIMGDHSVLSQCRERIETLPYLFALGGGLAESQLLLEFVQKGTADGDILIALGLSGNLEAVPGLLAYLKHPDYAPMAAQALQLLSGAGLYENVHVADTVEEDELFENELEDFKKGELPKNIDGNPYGSEIQQLSMEPMIWQEWLQKHKQQFVKGLRYRNGRAITAGELVQGLTDNRTAFKIRQFLYEELQIRYGLNIPFAVDDLVYRQKKQLDEIHNWVELHQSAVKAGAWYFNSSLL